MMSAFDVERLISHALCHTEEHRPEPGGCTCGFCAWSPDHVLIMAVRDGWTDLRHRQAQMVADELPDSAVTYLP